ncbi:MAG: hypothetical protein L0I62_01350 [Gammaproteobacteria bacterium]|nr:hypothetical protein [Gammaproteobacteria bacterium]
MTTVLALIILIALVILLDIIPVMISARLVKAGNTGFWSAAIAVFLQIVLSVLVHTFVPVRGIAILVAIVFGSWIFARILDTTFPRGFAVGLLSIIFTIAVVFLLVGMLGLFTVLQSSLYH